MSLVGSDESAGEDSNIRSFQLVFEGVTCDECGDTQPVTRSCKCGAWIPRDDEHVARRRSAIGDVQEWLARPVAPTTRIELDEALHLLSPWIAQLFDGLNKLGDKGADAGLVHASVAALLELRCRVAAVPRRRPWLALWDPFNEVLDALVALTRVELEAAVAPDPNTSQAMEVMAQGHLDVAAEAIARLNGRLDRWGIERTIRLPDSVVSAAAAAYDATGAVNIIDLDSRGRPLFTRITGRTKAPPGVGVGLLLDLGQVDLALDEDRVYAVAAIVHGRLDSYRDHLAALLDDPGWRADVLNARRVFYDAQLATETLVRELAGERRIEAAAVLRLGAQLTERVSAALVGLVVAADPSRRINRTAHYTEIHQEARDVGLRDTLLGFDHRIRNADAHTDYDVGDDYVVLGRNHAVPVRLSDDELVDVVLAAVESAAAMFAGLDCIVAELDHPSGQDRFSDLSVEHRIEVILAAAGVRPERVALRGDRIELSGSVAASSSVLPLSVIATLGPYLPAEYQRVRLHMKRRDATLVTEAPLGPLRRFQADEGMAKDAAFVELLGRTSINGRPVFSRRHTRFLVAIYAGRYVDAAAEVAEHDLEPLVAAARRLRDTELLESLVSFIEAKRVREKLPARRPASREAIDRLASYVDSPPGPWNDGSPRSPSGLVTA